LGKTEDDHGRHPIIPVPEVLEDREGRCQPSFKIGWKIVDQLFQIPIWKDLPSAPREEDFHNLPGRGFASGPKERKGRVEREPDKYMDSAFRKHTGGDCAFLSRATEHGRRYTESKRCPPGADAPGCLRFSSCLKSKRIRFFDISEKEGLKNTPSFPFNKFPKR